ncbi:MAG: beta-N-acetylhexosaminidase [Bdellovibrionales bacterium]
MEKIGQLFMIGLEGKTLSAKESDFIIKNDIGGVILFDRNLGTPQEIHKLCSDVQALRHKTKDKLPLFISIDMEGGRVARLKAPFTQWPAAAKIGALDSTSVAFRFAMSMGSELKAVGINLDYAPCIDVFTNPKNTVIGDRAFSTDPEQVAKMASAVVRGYIKSGVIACAKHFPGHGHTVIDSHLDLPVEDASMERLDEVELVPFKKVFRARVDMVMTAHIKFPKVDPEWPVTLSEVFIQKILRGQLRYRNLVISDDLDMKALAAHYDRDMIPVRALQAGCDILLYCNEHDRPPRALEMVKKAIADGNVKMAQIEESFKRVVALKKELLANPDPLPWSEASQMIGHPDHLKISKAIQEQKIPQELAAT